MIFLRTATLFAAVLTALLTPFSGAAAAQAPPSDLRVEIDPGDLIRLEVWGEKELSGEFLVDPFGLVTLPLVGEIEAAGRSWRELRDEVRGVFAVSFRDPAVQVIVLKRVRVLGAVAESGVFHLDPTMTVADALATAKGFTPAANHDRVQLRRGGEIVEEQLSTEWTLDDLRVQSGDELWVPERSWLERNLGAVVTGASGIVTVLVAFLVR